MNKNLKIVKKSEANNYFDRHLYFYKSDGGGGDLLDYRISNLIKVNNLNSKSVLEIGCSTGIKLNQYQQILNSKINYGIDLSSKAIKLGKKKYKNLKLLKLSSLEINEIKQEFDLIICGFFLYLLDREEIFNQFNLIYKKLKTNGYLIIEDYDPLFKHTNTSIRNKNLKSYKMSYDNFLEESGLFKVVYKIRNNYNLLKVNDKKLFKSSDVSLTLYKKIDYTDSYPHNI